MSLSVHRLVKRRPTFTLSADFRLGSEERLGLIGRSGGGKTSLLTMILGIELPDSGDILWNNRSLLQTPIQRRNFGVVFQDQGLISHLNVQQNLELGLKFHQFTEEERHRRVALWREALGLGLQQKIHELSGGERQKLAIARALIWDPVLLLLDEPLSALDQSSKLSVKNFILPILEERRTPCLMISHDPTDLRDLTHTSLALTEEDQGRRRAFHRASV